MVVHEEILAAVRAICAARGNWRFSLAEIVRVLPSLNESTVRTHVTSRCCVNAPKNHPHRWPYFKRVARGVYELMPGYRAKGEGLDTRMPSPLRNAVHVVVSRSDGQYVAECLEVPVITQAPDLETLLSNLREALELHVSDEDLGLLGLAKKLRIVMTADFPLAVGA